MHVILHLLTIGLLFALASCGEPLHVTTNNRQTMTLIINPATEMLLESGGYIITAAGDQDLEPATSEDWSNVKSAAEALVEAGNLLTLPGRSAGTDWDEYVSDLISASKLVMAAAQQQDVGTLFDAGERIYQACQTCHNQYLIDDITQ